MQELHAPVLAPADVALDLLEERALGIVPGQLPTQYGGRCHDGTLTEHLFPPVADGDYRPGLLGTSGE